MMNRTDYSLNQWLAWMEKNHPTEIDLGLARVGQVFARMQLDLSASKIVSVAGTNGKGSTTALLESIYLAAGYTTLAYTSPHMLFYNERVRLDGVNAENEQLTRAFRAIDQAMGDVERISLSYFEIGTLAALYLISVYKPEVAILEVGLGGRLDAVNIVDADVAVITTLAIDHVDWLGDDIEQIGREKAGIARRGRPLVCGELAPPSSIAIESKKQGFLLYQVNQKYSYDVPARDAKWHWNGLDIKGNALEYNDLALPSLPVQNAATALQVVALLGLPCDFAAIDNGLANAAALGRLQSVQYKSLPLVLDVAHNPQSAQYLAESLAAQNLTGKVHMVLGVLGDKDCEGVIKALAPVVAHWHFVALDVYRGQSAEQLGRWLENGVANQSCHYYDNMISALDAVERECSSAQQVVVAGSFVTVSQVLALL